MGDTIWVLRQGKTNSGDDYDHSTMLRCTDELDRLARKCKVRKLSDFYDWADYNFNMSDEELEEIGSRKTPSGMIQKKLWPALAYC